MAAEKREGFQEFPHASFKIPPQENIEEASAMSENLMEGQQGAGQSLQDPYTRAINYLEKHRIVEIFQVTMETQLKRALMVNCCMLVISQNLTSRIAYEKPENPLQFMLDEIAKIQRGEVLKELSTPSVYSIASHTLKQ